MQKLQIPIVIAAYNREASLNRLLESLSRASYPSDVDLVISIDGGPDNTAVVKTAERYHWKFGQKQVISSRENLGLRNHILQCGRLTREYDGIVLLEDDLYVSPYFYHYLIQAHEAYQSDEQITGVALYSHQYNETACLPFRPIEDGHDVFFMRVACSWGQSWLSHQWTAFDDWYEANDDVDLSHDKGIPPDVRLWPQTSWKKYFVKYMIERELYFVYPRISLATNFADPGTHHRGSNNFQVPLLHGPKVYSFPQVRDSFAKYDAYCEIEPSALEPHLPEAGGLRFEVDLYGMKNSRDISSELVLTTQPLRQPLKSFGRRLKPHETNVLENIAGASIRLGSAASVAEYGDYIKYRNKLNQDYENTHAYFYSITRQHYPPTIMELLISLPIRACAKFKRILKRLKPSDH